MVGNDATNSYSPEWLSNRLMDFAVDIVKLVNGLPRTMAGRHFAGQLLRSGTSVAANYEEACAAESRADFLHKLQVALKEGSESRFWLRLLVRTGIVTGPDAARVLQESEELCRILAKSAMTAKGKAGKSHEATGP